MRILCYGDSNVWGTIPDGTGRHMNIEKAWPKKLEKILNETSLGAEVIIEGLGSRTTDLDDEKFPIGNRNGALYFPQCVVSHDPLDYIVLLIGTNDFKTKFNRSAQETALAIENKYVKLLKEDLAHKLEKMPKIILVCPPQLVASRCPWVDYDETSEKKSKAFCGELSAVAERNHCLFVSNDKIIAGQDGAHMTEQSHAELAAIVAKTILADLCKTETNLIEK